MECTVTFKFSPGEIVFTDLDEEAIVDDCAINRNKDKCYYVQTKTNGGKWAFEENLKSREDLKEDK